MCIRDRPDALFVPPATGLFASGPFGGPFSPACVSFPLTNLSDRPIRWAAIVREPWLQAAPSSGTLVPGAIANVVVCVASNATVLPVGTYQDSIVFANLDSGVSQM